MLDQYRNHFKWLETKTANIFAVFPITPNQYTLFSIVFALICGYFVIYGQYWLAVGFLLIASMLDFIDGAVARAKNLSTKKGAYWDTISDRYVESILLFALLFVGLPAFYLPSYAWIFLVLFGSTMTTYAKAAAKEKELSSTELKGGLMSRAERLAFYLVILAVLNYSADWAVYLLALLAILANITAIQRIYKAMAN